HSDCLVEFLSANKPYLKANRLPFCVEAGWRATSIKIIRKKTKAQTSLADLSGYCMCRPGMLVARVPLRTVFAVALVLLGTATVAFAQESGRFDFQYANKPVADILRAIGGLAGKSVVPDDTVTGIASYILSSATFDEAIELILADNNLYLDVRNNVYLVSRVSV